MTSDLSAPAARGDLELELERQTLRPGETLCGRVLGHGQASPGWALSLQGEEILSADSIAINYILPLVDESQVVPARAWSPEGWPFELVLPAHAPPTYASLDMRCQYFVKLHKKGFLGRSRLIRRMHMTVLPPEPPEDPAPRCLTLSSGPVKVDVQLDRTCLRTGDSLTGELWFHREDTTAALPRRLTFRFAAIEEAVEPGYRHRKVLWLATHDVEPEEGMTYPLRGMFEFPIPPEAPFSGEWTAFRVHYGFRVGVYLADGSDVRESVPIQVDRVYTPLAPSGGGFAAPLHPPQ